MNVVKRMLERMGAVSEGSDVEQAMGWEERIEEGLGDMEHGGLVELEPDVWLVPRPNEHELFGNMLAGQAGLVVVLLDPSGPEQDAAIREMTRLFDDHDIAYRLRPLASGDAATTCSVTDLTIFSFVVTRSSRLMPGLRGMPAVMTTTSEPAMSA